MTTQLDHLTERDHWVAAFWLLLTVSLGAVYILLADICGFGTQNGFTISAVSERVAVTIDHQDGLSVRLSPGLTIPRLGLHLTQSALLHLPDRSQLDIARRATGTVYLQLEDPGRSGRATLTAADGQVFDLGGNDVLELSSSPGSAPSFILPFRGAVSLAPEIREGVEYLLLSGNATAFEQPLFGRRRAVLTAQLAQGDEVRWDGDSPNSGHQLDAPQQASGFIEVGEGEAINVVAHVVATRLKVWRYGAEPYIVQPSKWDAITKDPLVSILAVLFGALGALFVAYEGIVNILGAWKGRGKGGAGAKTVPSQN